MKPPAWRHPLMLAGLSEALYLLYFHVAASAPHSALLFTWLPFGGWRAAGPISASMLYAACLSFLFILYALLLKDLTGQAESSRDRSIVFSGAALFSVTLLFLPSLLSKDLFDYMGHGRVLAVYGANPFTTPASTFPPDQFSQAMGWSSATPLYGPAWLSICALLALLGGGSFLMTAILFKLIFIGVHLINGLLVLWVARGRAGRPGSELLHPLRSAAFYLWNPLVLTQTAGDAHNDGVVLLWLLLGIWLMQRRDTILGSATAAMSVLIKYVTAPVVLLLAIHNYRDGGAGRAAVVLITCVGMAALAYAPYLSGFDAAYLLRPYQHADYESSFMMLLEMAVGKMTSGEGGPGTPLAWVMLMATLVAAGILGVWYLRACLRVKSLMDAVEAGTRLLLLYLLFITPVLRISYVVWIVGLAALVASMALRRAVAIFSFTILALEVFWVYRILQPSLATSVNPERFAASAVALGVPILYLLLHFRGWPRPGWGRRGGQAAT